MSKFPPIKTFDPDEFVNKAAEELRTILEEALEKSERITVALSGGNSPLPVYEKLRAFSLDWKRVVFFLVDERCSTTESVDNNYKNIKNVFFDHIESQSYPMIIDGKSYEECAQAYQKNITTHIPIVDDIPCFDLIILGMGLDGHIASLFPKTKALKEKEQWIVLNKVPQLETERITMTYPLLINSKKIVLLIKGEEKKEVLLNAEKQNLPVFVVTPRIDVVIN